MFGVHPALRTDRQKASALHPSLLPADHAPAKGFDDDQLLQDIAEVRRGAFNESHWPATSQ
jgi:hypothetical protein